MVKTQEVMDNLFRFMFLVRNGEVPKASDGRILKVKIFKNDPAIDSPEFEELLNLRQHVMDTEMEFFNKLVDTLNK